MNSLINEEDISTFNWSELHHRVVRVICVEDSGMQSTALYDAETQELFIVSVKAVEELK